MNKPDEHERGRSHRWIVLAGFLLVCIAVEIVGGLLTSISVKDWYLTIRKPSWTPPGGVFGPVWTFLYLSMGVAAWLVWDRRNQQNIRPAMILFAIQLALNLTWSGLFFGLQSPMLASWEIVLLWLAILATLVTFWRARRLAGALLIPYIAWVSYASALTIAIWRMNP